MIAGSSSASPSSCGTRKKITELESLADTIATMKSTGKRVVLCHGVFDLLHIGHIRHFEEARSYGDVLVVTLTPDRFVNKGPHRPAFSQDLRAEALAALDCVDFVAVNRWPMAVELLKLLQPNFYAKGKDYQDAEQDVTGGITLEREAVESVGGKLIFTDDVTFSSSTLINRHLSGFSKELAEYLEAFSTRTSCDEILKYLNQMRPMRVMVVGEAIIDEYRYCKAIGKSSKDPMLAVKQLTTEKFAGGSLAFANNVASFCDHVSLMTMLGERESQIEFITSKLKDEIKTHFLFRKNAPTIVKTRFIEEYFFSKLFEVYTIDDSELDSTSNEDLCSRLEDTLDQFDAVLVVDFGHSMLTPEAAEVICNKARFLGLNTQSNAGNLGYQSLYKYPRADFICVTENEARLEARQRTGDFRQFLPKLAKDLSCRTVLTTRGSHGSIAFSEEEGFVETPAFAARVVDRMGAGDAFFSATGLAAALGVPLEALGFIGNAIGAQAVATVGHRESINKVSLTKFITSLLK